MSTKKLCFVFLLVVCIAGTVLVSRHFLSTVDEIKKDLGDVSVDLSLGGVTLRQGKDGHLLWTLNATAADYQKNAGFVFLTSPKILYFQDDNPDPLYVEGDHGKVDQKNDQAFVWSNVTARYQDTLVTTANLHYDGKQRLLIFEKDVVVERGDLRLLADSAELDLKDEQLQAHGNVRASIIASTLP
jgi:LPS export ABC transporter protein LptC